MHVIALLLDGAYDRLKEISASVDTEGDPLEVHGQSFFWLALPASASAHCISATGTQPPASLSAQHSIKKICLTR